MKPVLGPIKNLITSEVSYLKNQDDLINYKAYSKQKISGTNCILFRDQNNQSWCQPYSLIFKYFKFKRNTIDNKLTEEQAREIFLTAKQKIFSQQEIANMFGVSRTTVSKILNKELWREITKGL